MVVRVENTVKKCRIPAKNIQININTFVSLNGVTGGSACSTKNHKNARNKSSYKAILKT